MLDVAAWVLADPRRPELAEATRAAVVDEGIGVVVGGLGEGKPPVDTSAWVWLLDGVTVPEPGALRAFEDALVRLANLPAPLVLASRVVDGTGALHPDAAPRHEVFEKELTLAAVERRLVQLRAAPSGSLLVRREAFVRFGALRADLPPSWSAFDFTGRVLQDRADTGYLVPESRAVRRVAPRPTGRAGGALRSRVRLLAGPTWGPTERLWEGFLVGEAMLRGGRGPAPRA